MPQGPLRTNRTRRVPHPVLIGHAVSLAAPPPSGRRTARVARPGQDRRGPCVGPGGRRAPAPGAESAFWSPPPPPRTKWTRRVPSPRTNWTHRVPPPPPFPHALVHPACRRAPPSTLHAAPRPCPALPAPDAGRRVRAPQEKQARDRQQCQERVSGILQPLPTPGSQGPRGAPP